MIILNHKLFNIIQLFCMNFNFIRFNNRTFNSTLINSLNISYSGLYKILYKIDCYIGGAPIIKR